MRPYVALWQRLREYGQPCVVANAVVVSEVVNRFLRLRFDVWRNSPQTATDLRANGELSAGERIDYKKHFRGTPIYKATLDLFLAAWDEISWYIVYKENEVESSIVPAMLRKYGKQTDFNDKFYVEFCKAHELWLVTHDGDFYAGGITVITANENILEQYEEMKRRQR